MIMTMHKIHCLVDVVSAKAHACLESSVDRYAADMLPDLTSNDETASVFRHCLPQFHEAKRCQNAFQLPTCVFSMGEAVASAIRIDLRYIARSNCTIDLNQ